MRARQAFFEEESKNYRGNARKDVAGLVSVQEEWNGKQRRTARNVPTLDKIWRSKCTANYGLIGYIDLNEAQKSFNRRTAAWLLDADKTPWLHVMDGVSSYMFRSVELANNEI